MRSTTATTWTTSAADPRLPLALDRLAGTRSTALLAQRIGGEVCPPPARIDDTGISVSTVRVLPTTRFRTVPGVAPGGPPA